MIIDGPSGAVETASQYSIALASARARTGKAIDESVNILSHYDAKVSPF
jgi:hypothetical protein